MKIVLASKSQRRYDILKMLGIDFVVATENTDERFDYEVSPSELVMGLALRKARAVAPNVDFNDIIIAADTLVFQNGKPIGKPKDENDAKEIIRSLSGTTHEVYSGIAVMGGGKVALEYDMAKVTMRKVLESEMNLYLKTGEPFDKAGGYGIQEIGGLFVEKIEGDFFSVVGLPLCKLGLVLRNQFDYDILWNSLYSEKITK